MPGFLKRKMMDRIANNLYAAYFSEANRLTSLGVPVTGPAEVLHVHGLSWRHAQQSVFRSRTAAEVLGDYRTANAIADAHLAELAERTGVGVAAIQQFKLQADRAEIEQMKGELPQQLRELDESPDSKKPELAYSFYLTLRLVKPGADEEWDAAVEDFRSKYGHSLEKYLS